MPRINNPKTFSLPLTVLMRLQELANDLHILAVFRCDTVENAGVAP